MFQSAPPHGRRRASIGLFKGAPWFQSAPPHGRRLVRFQSAPPHGRRPFERRQKRRSRACFNPRLRTGGDEMEYCRDANPWLFQSAPPHGRRRRRVELFPSPRLVSIRASAREATVASNAATSVTCGFNPRLRTGGDWCAETGTTAQRHVSIRASAREATRGDRERSDRRSGFNPRLRTGGDSKGLSYSLIGFQVSIRASAREAT